jgi:hypothetical protein
MKKFVAFAFAFTFVLLGAGTAAAENDTAAHNVTVTVNEVALVDVTSQGLLFEIGATGGEAGEPFYVSPNDGTDFDTGYDDSSYLQYTSIVPETGSRRNITVHIDSAENIPAGFKFYVKAAAPVTSGSGDRGTAQTSRIDLLDAVAVAETLVADVGSGYTGNGASDGINLVYELEMIEGSADLLYSNSYSPVVTYTLTDSTAEGL